MKKVIKISLLMITMLGGYSCSVIHTPLASTKAVNNKTYTVEYLFEHEGCKVYRFEDNGNYVYYTNCKGDVTSIKNDSSQVRVMNQVRETNVK